MMGDGADRLAVIGMGWIGAYMVPCYRSLLGEGYEKRMFAVKAGSRGIEELRHRYGFEIIAGNCLDKLKEYKPGILVLSVRPHEVAGVAEDTIKPYVKSPLLPVRVLNGIPGSWVTVSGPYASCRPWRR